ncbi:MAG: ABC-2 type transport system ATP-binding protein [Verrucomicrobiales bacterium]|jgi:ABC-2 type transport system ATP-binding protein
MTSGLVVEGLKKHFGDIRAVDGIDLQVPPGATVGFLGSNGAGKTTAMRMILDIIRPDHGSITWNGQSIDDSVRNRIGYMPQERGLYARMGVHDQVAYFGKLAGMSKTNAGDQADYWIERLGLAERRGDLVQELSGGNQQRVQLAVSLVHGPELLVLDEPFAGLDPVAAETMQAILSERAADGVSVLFSSHQLDLVEHLSDHVVIVSNGREVASGRPIDLRMAAPNREMIVEWAEDIVTWAPIEGEMLEFTGSRARVILPGTADIGEQIAHAVAAGPIALLTVEPPSLAEVFADSVGNAGQNVAAEDPS